jgi:hypothetical protein
VEEWITKDSNGVSIIGWGEFTFQGHTGEIDTYDINGDGSEELLIRPEESNFVWIYQGNGKQISSSFGIWIEHDFQGIPQLADITGNDSYEVVVVSSTDELYSSWFPEEN